MLEKCKKEINQPSSSLEVHGKRRVLKSFIASVEDTSLKEEDLTIVMEKV